MSQEYSFKLSFEDFDIDLIGFSAGQSDSAEFGAKVTEFFAQQFKSFGGKARVVINDQDRVIEVRWTKDANWSDPKDSILNLLNRAEFVKAVPMIWTLIKNDPSDLDNYYNLGVVYSELKQLPKAIATLEHVVELYPKHVLALIALGVAQIRTGKLQFGEESLRRALSLEPKNRWALRNLGACLMKQERPNEAIDILRRCLNEAPNDVQALIGLGEALEQSGSIEEADDLYLKAIQVGGPDEILDIAKDRRTKLAHAKLRSRMDFRTDAMMYISGALDKFSTMTPNEIRNLGFEVALLGMNGLDINDPTEKYSLKAIPGTFSGLHLLSIMYAAFKQFAPNEDVGIDLSKEYEAATQLNG